MLKEEEIKALSALYDEKFRPLNSQFKQIATDWQMRRVPGGGYMLNDHTDSEYDFRVLDKLFNLHNDVLSIRDSIISLLPECKDYFDKLEEAINKIENGENQFFTKPDIASYHTVWFEMHDHILKILGRERAEDEV